MRREWIEISISRSDLPLKRSPSMRREWIEMKRIAAAASAVVSLPPCGGSGLK